MKHPSNEATFRDEFTPSCRSPVLCILLVVSAFLLILFDIIEINYYSYLPSKIYATEQNDIKAIEIQNQKQTGFLVKNEGCRIPDLDPFDSAILDYIEHPATIDCHNKTNPPLIYSDLNSLYVNISALAAYDTDADNIECCYSSFVRVEPKKKDLDRQFTTNSQCIKFYNSTPVYDEFVKVVCKMSHGRNYTDYFSFVPASKVENKSQQYQNADRKDQFSVLILGIDAVSRINLHRQMPKTVDFLLNKLKAREMYGYNKVGDNTFPNLMPVLTGMTENELKNVCLSNSKSRFDGCPLIWYNYSDAGYVTVYGEDATEIGLFDYQRNGFKKQATDYDWRIFDRVATSNIGHKKELNAHLCVGPRLQLDMFLDYTTKFVTTFRNQPFFGFFWAVSLSHDFLNYPALGDDSYVNFLEDLLDKGIFKNTIVIFMSDHGIRWGSIRKTYQGRMEERLPFLFFVVPDQFTEKYPNAVVNLVRNTKALTTPFDLHVTLNDLLHPENLEQSVLRQRSSYMAPDERGISLFLPISKNRTCENAGITDHWCTCQKQAQGNVKDPHVKLVAQHVVTHINNLLEGYAQCSKLQLTEIISVYQSMNHKGLVGERKDTLIVDYTVVLKTTPGDGLFEATVRRRKTDGDILDYSVTGTVSRINLYGSQSRCITDFHLKLYCYCL